MTLKAIEMQIALPRTHDAGKIQDQMHQRGQLLQDHAAHSASKEETKVRTTVMRKDQKSKAEWTNQKGSDHQSDEKNQKEKKNDEKQLHKPHPYKGKIIDYSG